MNETQNNVENFDPVGKHTLEVISKASRFNRWMYSQIRPFLKGNVLEIGSGIGNISKFIIQDGYTITLSDYNPEYYRLLKNHFADAPNVADILSIDLVQPDFKTQYRAREESFDSIILMNVIEHIADDKKAIENCKYLLKPGGHLIVLAPAYQWLYCKFDTELGHFRRYTLKNMVLLLTNQSFGIILKRHFNLIAIPGWFFSGKVLRGKMIGENEMSFFDKIVPVAKLLDQLFFKKTGISIIVIGIKNS